MLWNIGKRCKSAGSPFLNCHAVDVRSHSDVVILAAWEGHLNNIHVGVLITFPAPAYSSLMMRSMTACRAFGIGRYESHLSTWRLLTPHRDAKTSLLISMSSKNARILSLNSSMASYFQKGRQGQVFSGTFTFWENNE